MQKDKIKKIKKLFSDYNQNKIIISKFSNLMVRERNMDYGKVKRGVKDVNECKREVVLVDLLYKQLDDEEREIIDMRYKKKLSIIEVSELIFVSEATLFRKLRKIFKKLERYYNLFEDIFDNR